MEESGSRHDSSSSSSSTVDVVHTSQAESGSRTLGAGKQTRCRRDAGDGGAFP